MWSDVYLHNLNYSAGGIAPTSIYSNSHVTFPSLHFPSQPGDPSDLLPSKCRQRICLRFLYSATYRRPLERLDRQYHGTVEGQTGPLVTRLNSYGELQCIVGGAWGEGSLHLHSLLQACGDSRVDLCRSTGRQELRGQHSVIISQYRRLVSTCMVRAPAQCLISRVGITTPAAQGAARRREGAKRVERQLPLLPYNFGHLSFQWKPFSSESL